MQELQRYRAKRDGFIFHADRNLSAEQRKSLNVVKGFTLIELLVVSTIIITLIGIGSVSYVRALQTSRDSRRKTDLEQIRQALETYRSENGSYPTTATWKNSGVLYPTYLTTIPSDPKAGYLYGYIRTTATTYVLCAALEVTTTPISCGTGTCGTGTCSYAATNP